MRLYAERTLVHSCELVGAGVTNSTIEPESVGKICFRRLQFGKRIAIGHYSATVMWVNLYGSEDLDTRSLKRAISVSADEFWTYAVRIRYNVKDSGRRSYHIWRVPVLFNPLHFIYDPQYLEGDTTLWIVKNWNRSQADVGFVQKLFPESFSALKRRNIVYFGHYVILSR